MLLFDVTILAVFYAFIRVSVVTEIQYDMFQGFVFGQGDLFEKIKTRGQLHFSPKTSAEPSHIILTKMLSF